MAVVRPFLHARMLRRAAPAALALSAAALVPPAHGAHREGDAGTRPLVSHFGHDLDRVPRDEGHPTPQLRRADWRSLNGTWRIRLGEERRFRDILVPFPYQAPLSGIGRRRTHTAVRYTRTFTVPREWRGQRLKLHFGAVDWEAKVYVDGRYAGRHRGGYTPFAFDVTGELDRGRERHRLTVVVRDPPDEVRPIGKQRARGRIFYTRTTGIWQPVWLEPVADRHISSLRLDPRLDTGRLVVSARVRGGKGARLHAKVRRGGRTLVRRDVATRDGVTTFALRVPDVEPWSPESPALYDVNLRVRREGETVDHVASYTAFRTVEIRDGRFHLNGAPYFLRGVLDQGFWPGGLYAAPSDAALRADVEAAKAFGFNLARKHVKVEDARWYWHADRLGLLVAQDMPSGWDAPGVREEHAFEREWLEMIDTLRGHPSIALWIAFNESWGKPTEAFQRRIVEAGRAADPTRLYIDGSGSPRRGLGDLDDVHDYRDDLARWAPGDPPPFARWIGEYGGITLKVPGHVWKTGRQRFTQGSRDVDDLLERYRFLTDQVNQAPGLSGFVYTQLTDVENELNGLLTYDRLAKVDPGRIARINRTPPAR